ncbi:hypothetical protein C2G38_113728 [Gigaspora rosea]|uniref:Galactose oxidase n=1 Tax=Gigaspora rosea TaxID=44941 RepID=A0A397VYT2_9GLOM|nr:hypothetical protein C2G38_113728 [Gigaspora rosea]
MNFISRKSSLIFMGLIIMSVSEDIGPLASHCVVTYNNSFYIFGGTIGCETFASTNFFHKATPPFSQAKISWEPLSTINVKSVTDPGCIVDETRGLLFVLGGANKQINSTSPGLQVYDFNTQIWNEPQYSQNFIPPDLINDGWGPRAVWVQPGLMFIWGASSIIQGSYLLDIKYTPWQWTVLSDNKSNIVVPTKDSAVVAIKGNAFIFGGFHMSDNKSISNTLYIHSPKYGFLTPQFHLPVPFNDGVVGVWNDKLSIIMLDASEPIMGVANFDLKTFQFNVTYAPNITNITTTRSRGHGAQFSWSDSVFIYGGTGNYCGQPILDTWVVYNMSSQTWETTFNDIKHTNIISNNLTLPKVNGLDINNEVTVVQQSTSAATSVNNKILIIILSSTIAILLIVFTVIFIHMKRIINQYKEFYPMIEHSEISATRVVNI